MIQDRPLVPQQTRGRSQRQDITTVVLATLGVHPIQAPQAGALPPLPLIFRIGPRMKHSSQILPHSSQFEEKEDSADNEVDAHFGFGDKVQSGAVSGSIEEEDAPNSQFEEGSENISSSARESTLGWVAPHDQKGTTPVLLEITLSASQDAPLVAQDT